MKATTASTVTVPSSMPSSTGTSTVGAATPEAATKVPGEMTPAETAAAAAAATPPVGDQGRLKRGGDDEGGEKSDEDSDTTASESSGDGSPGDDEGMPLLHYRRLRRHRGATATAGSHEEDPPVPLTASCLGKVVLNVESTLPMTSGALEQPTTSSGGATATLPASSSSTAALLPPPPANLWRRDPLPLLLLGSADGGLAVWAVAADGAAAAPVLLRPQGAAPLSSATGDAAARALTRRLLALPEATSAPGPDAVTVLDGAETVVPVPTRPEPRFSNSSKRAIVDVGIDASGTLLAAINKAGTLGLFQARYQLVWGAATDPQVTTTTTAPASGAGAAAPVAPSPSHGGVGISSRDKPKPGNPFSGILSAFRSKQLESSVPVQPTTSTTEQSVALEPAHSGTRDELTLATDSSEDSHLVPTLAFASVTLAHRIGYPPSFGPPTCLALDPASVARREIALVVGFRSGRLMLTRKRGLFVQRRVDSVLYQGTGAVPAAGEDDADMDANAPGDCSIQALVWRGSLLAWADASGIRIMDMDTLTRLAHVDRPTGARPSLYPTIGDLKPHLVFETAETLVCGWGDCLLCLQIRETASLTVAQGHQIESSFTRKGLMNEHSNNTSLSSHGEENSTMSGEDVTDDALVSTATADASQTSPLESPPSSPPPPNPNPTTSSQQPSSSFTNSLSRRRRIVECTMAWQLDCVAIGVSPLDEDHVAVLGLVPPRWVSDGESESEGTASSNEVEMQIISRTSGAMVHSDLLPLLRPSVDEFIGGNTIEDRSKTDEADSRINEDNPVESMSAYNLLSTFCFPRMDDTRESRDEQLRLQQEDDYDGALFAFNRRHKFIDSHLKWKLEMNLFADDTDQNDNVGDHEVDDISSVDSDDYDIGAKLATSPGTTPSGSFSDMVAPCMVVVSETDVVLVKLSDIDDAISDALARKKAALALRRALLNVRRIKQYDIRRLVDEYFRALLRLPENVNAGCQDMTKKLDSALPTDSDQFHLSLRRMKLAAEAMPILIGGDVDMWLRWINEIEKIPGALFFARKFVPVRDPILPLAAYGRILEKMLLQVEEMSPGHLADEAASHFLDTLVAWGTTSVLKRFIKLFQFESMTDRRIAAPLRAMEESLKRRETQSAASYLQFSPAAPNTTHSSIKNYGAEGIEDASNALFDIDSMVTFILSRVPHTSMGETPDKTEKDSVGQRDSRVALEALVRLKMMKSSFDDALRYYLMIGSHYASSKLDDIEEDAIRTVNVVSMSYQESSMHPASYTHVISIIESLHLHQCLLDVNFIGDDGLPPLFALLQLVGLDILGDFLVENSISPQGNSTSNRTVDVSLVQPLIEEATATVGERRGTLPLDLVARQLERRPKLLYWYLHLIFTRKPEIYVKFPTTASPPEEITRLHRKHIDLYIRYAGNNRDSSAIFKGIEAFRVPDTNTPLLSFLKVAIQLGTISTNEVAKKIEVERKGGDDNSHTFALELAFIMEQFGGEHENEAHLILDLYLKGVENLMLAVAFAQRSRHSAALWKFLIDFCLESVAPGSKNRSKSTSDGSLFGSLLEAAALSGGDLANLISQIPSEIAIEGLRPRLVSAVTDYRLKVQIAEKATILSGIERKILLQEVEHRSRRGVRVDCGSGSRVLSPKVLSVKPTTATLQGNNISTNTFKKQRLPSPDRLDHQKFSLKLLSH